MLTKRAEMLDPTQLLKRGYSITTTKEGKIVRDPKTLINGEVIMTQVEQGTIISVVAPDVASDITTTSARRTKQH